MDLSTVASFITLEPSQLFRAERFVEQGLKMYDSDGELTEAYLKEHLHGVTLDYAMHVLDETSTSYMDVAIHNQGGKFSAPTAGVYGVSSRPEIKKKIKEKVLKKNELAKKLKKMHKEEVEHVDEAVYGGTPAKKEAPKDTRRVVTNADKKANTPAYQKMKAGDKRYKAADHMGEEVENVEELYKGKHGQSEKEYQAGRSDAGKRISGDEKHGPASYTRRGVLGQKPTKPGEKPKHTPKLGSAEKNELAYRKNRLKKANEEVVNEEGADRLKDRRMERGGVDGNVRYDKPNRNPETKTSVTQKKDSMSAFDKVASDLKKKYGDKAVTTSKKTVKKEEIDIRKISEGKCEDCDCKGCGDDGVRHQNPCVECGGHHKEEKEVDEAMVKLKGKKKGNVIINPEVKVTEDADVAKKQQVQRKQLMINKQKLALQQRATTKKKPTDMHMEETEDIQEVDVTTRSVDYGQEIENTALKRKKEKKSLSDFKKLSKPKNLNVK